MAKFTRFDPRNKKQNRNKIRSLEKDFRFHEKKRKRGKFKWNYWEILDSKGENLKENQILSN